MAMRLAMGCTAITKREIMQKIIILLAAALLAGVTFANAENKGDLIKPSYSSQITGDDEKDTFVFNTDLPSDLRSHFSARCYAESSCADITTGFFSNDANADLQATYSGKITGYEENDTFAY